MAEHMTHDEYVQQQEREIVRIAKEMLAGRMDILEGSWLLNALYPEVSSVDFDPDFMDFVVIASETDHLPVGRQRKYWSAEARVEKDVEIQRITDQCREQALAGCRRLIVRFEGET